MSPVSAPEVTLQPIQAAGATPDPATTALARIIIETERLQLRELTLQDAAFIASIFDDDAARRFYPEMRRLENAQRWVRRNLETYARDGFGLWAVLLRSSGEIAGDCGLMRQHVEGVEEIEVGYHLHASFRGRGIATEAAAACVQWGFANLNCTRIVSMVHPENHASQAVSKRVHPKSRRFWRHGAHYHLFFTERA